MIEQFSNQVVPFEKQDPARYQINRKSWFHEALVEMSMFGLAVLLKTNPLT